MAHMSGSAGVLTLGDTTMDIEKWTLEYKSLPTGYEVGLVFREVGNPNRQHELLVRQLVEALRENRQLLKNLRAFECDANIEYIPPIGLFQGGGQFVRRSPPKTSMVTTEMTLVVNDPLPFEALQRSGDVTVGALFGALLGEIPIEELPALLVHRDSCVRAGAREIMEDRNGKETVCNDISR